MKVAALVPMRHSSERVPGKNYRPLGDKPLYQWIVDTLLAVDAIGEVVIDTDSPTITDQVGAAYGDRVRVLVRPEHLRAGEIPMNDVLLNTVRQLDADFFLQTHSTNPFLKASTIATAMQRFADAQGDYDSLFSVTRIQARLWDQHVQAVNHDPAVLLRTQDLDPIYLENSCMYLFTEANLVKRGNRIGERPLMFEMDPLEAVDIDEPRDFAFAEALVASGWSA